MTTKAELIAALGKLAANAVSHLDGNAYREALRIAKQIPDDPPNPFAGVETYFPKLAGMKIIDFRPPLIGEAFIDCTGQIQTCSIVYGKSEQRFILAPPDPPKTWACPGLVDGAYEANKHMLVWMSSDGCESLCVSWSKWAEKFNSKLTKPEHFGTYDVANEVGTLREGT